MRQFMHSNGWVDLGLFGPIFTWSNKRSRAALIHERLDSKVSNGDWRILFSRATITHNARTTSDHSPLLLDTFGDLSLGPCPFRFEAFWVKTPCREVVDNSWRAYVPGSPTYQLCQKTKILKPEFRI